MGIGIKIKEYRTNAGLTQKELADQLHVTYQAVSRWENEDAEPSIDTLKEMCKILNCTTDDLFGLNVELAEKPKEKENEIKKPIMKVKKPILGVCEECNRPIFDSTELKRVTVSQRVSDGDGYKNEIHQKILCKSCNEKRLSQETKTTIEKKKRISNDFKEVRIHSFVWAALAALILIIGSISNFVKGNTTYGIVGLVFSVLVYCLIATLILNNTFIPEMWGEIASWGFVKLPGIIFEFSLDGFIFLIVVKIIFFLLGIFLAIMSIIFATFVALVLSVFVYPFALRKNIRCEE